LELLTKSGVVQQRCKPLASAAPVDVKNTTLGFSGIFHIPVEHRPEGFPYSRIFMQIFGGLIGNAPAIQIRD